LELLEHIFTIPGVKVFFSERLSQDPLEKFFGCQRQRGPTNENLNVVQFCKNTQALRVINGVCGNVSKSNCRSNKTSVNWGKENCPLPKQRKCKPQVSSSRNVSQSIHSSSSQEEDPSDTVMSSSNTMKQAITLSEHQNHLVGSSSSQEEDPSDTVMSSSNTMKQEEFQPLSHDKISTHLVYPSPLVQLIDDALKSGIANEELSKNFHISLKRSDFWLLRETGWLNDKVSRQLLMVHILWHYFLFTDYQLLYEANY